MNEATTSPRRARALTAAALAAATLLGTSGCMAGALPLPSPTDVNPSAPSANSAGREMAVAQQLRIISQGEQFYNLDHSKYGTIPELVAAGKLNRAPDGLGYTFTLTVAPDGQSYTVSAVPEVYGPNGQRSFFLDQSGVTRAANHGGAPATASDPPATDLNGN